MGLILTNSSSMKINLFLFIFFISILACSSSENIFILKPSQSMLMAGKGPGQDGAINPYINENSIAVVKNLGQNSLQARIQEKGEIIEVITLAPSERKDIQLKKGYELYLDSELEAKVRLDFKRWAE